jgi:hypothetical protein
LQSAKSKHPLQVKELGPCYEPSTLPKKRAALGYHPAPQSTQGIRSREN